MSQSIRGQGGHLSFPIGQKTQTWSRILRSRFLSSFVEFHSAVSEMKLKCLSQSEAKVAILVYKSAQKSTNIVMNFEFLLPDKLRQISFNSFREKK